MRHGRSNDKIPVKNHGVVGVPIDSGGREEVLACRIEDEDITEDGEIEMPLSGECECVDGERSEPTGTTPNDVLYGIVEEWRIKADNFLEIHEENDGIDLLSEVSRLEMEANKLERVIENTENSQKRAGSYRER